MELPMNICFAVSGSTFSSNIMIVRPRSSLPRLPARPLIWMYSPDWSMRYSMPSHLRVFVKTTVFAGMLMPMAKVSVEKRTFSRDSWKRISTTSFSIGSRPPWWMPRPRRSRGSMLWTCGSSRSSSLRVMMALLKTSSMSFFSSSSVTSIFLRATALASHSLRLKEKTMSGRYPRSLHMRTIFSRSLTLALPRFFCAFLVSTFVDSAPCCKAEIARWKLSSRKAPFSSTTMYTPSPPAGKR
mmetsp:Transcript_109457/g.309356  ORF Transcript_109457/g.309356 Transcript_109457/m.309356 type:complete len:241 (+) Transcript_109457:1576-2298(+)